MHTLEFGSNKGYKMEGTLNSKYQSFYHVSLVMQVKHVRPEEGLKYRVESYWLIIHLNTGDNVIFYQYVKLILEQYFRIDHAELDHRAGRTTWTDWHLVGLQLFTCNHLPDK